MLPYVFIILRVGARSAFYYFDMTEHIYYPSEDKKTTVHACIWRPRGKATGVLQIIHGMAEYAERYARFAEFLAERGFLVCAEDHIGHGQSVISGEDLGYFADGDATDIVLSDISRLTSIVKEQTGSLPYFVLGHSMGSFFCRCLIAKRGEDYDGAIIMGTGFQPPFVAGFAKFVARTVALFKGWRHRSPLIDGLAFGSYNKKFQGRTPFDWLSADSDNVDRYIADELCGVMFTCSGFYTLFSVLKRACSDKTINAVPKDLPVFLVSGGDDPVGAYSAGVIKLYDKFNACGVSDVEMTIYNDCRHEILNDFCAPSVMEDILSFMTGHICASL